MNRGLRTLARAACLASALAAMYAAPAPADVITPDTLADEYGIGPSTCSLREAVQASNTDTAFGGCPTGNGSDEIQLGTGVYQLSTAGTGAATNDEGDLHVTSGDTLTIRHDGSGRTAIDGGGLDRVIYSQGTLILRGLEIRNGNTTPAGGGNAGGIASEGSLTLLNVTVDGNTASPGYGAGVWAFSGTATLTNVTISGNVAENGAGGLYAGASVGLDNVTVTGNTADSDGDGGDGGGVAAPGGIAMENTVIAGNVDAQAPDCSGSLNPDGENLVGNTAGCSVPVSPDTRVNVASGLSPTLADNGGPVPTHAIAPGSNSADTSTVCLTTADARGYPKPSTAGGLCDLGAYELYTCSGSPLNAAGAFAGCPPPPQAKAPEAKKRKCKKGRKLKKGKCVKKKRKGRK